jgi:hypothetical protein
MLMTTIDIKTDYEVKGMVKGTSIVGNEKSPN